MKKSGQTASTSSIKKSTGADRRLRFSFEFFDSNDTEMCPSSFGEGYTQKLMERLRGLSTWTIGTFTQKQDPSLRNHQHDWSKTAREQGFQHLNEYYRAYPGWQFCLSLSQHGRVHGIIIDDTFHIIWLDQDHKLYPKKKNS